MAMPSASIDASSDELECRSGLGLARLTVAIDNSRLGSETPKVPYNGTLTVILSPQ
jgi:hypothetical protein